MPLFTLFASMALVIGLIAWLRLHAFVALLVGATFVALSAPSVPLADAATQVAVEFGAVCGKIGVVIALASVVGAALQESGGAARISRAFLQVTGERRGHLSLWGSGYVLAVPVFFDTVFYLLAPLARAMGGAPTQARSPLGGTAPPYPLCVMAIVAGAASTHVFVPPTPGPLAAASALGADLGTVIAVGMIVALPASLAGVAYGQWVTWRMAARGNRGTDIPEHTTTLVHGLGPDPAGPPPPAAPPPLWAALAPIVLPVVLISGRTVAAAAGVTGPAASAVAFAGDPNAALFLSATIAMWLVVRATAIDRRGLAILTENALASAGSIILITAAGGAYGAMLSRSGIGASLADVGSASGLPTLWLAFLLAAVLKIAQGSSTVAIITAASVLQPAYGAPDAAGLPHPAYAVTALAGGSLVVSWMNDSGFWIIGRLGGFSDRETLRYWTAVAAIVGTTGFLVTLLLAWIFPMRG